MSSLEIYQKMRDMQKAVFSLSDISLLLGQKKKSAVVSASRLVKKGILQKVEKGKFCMVGEDVKAVACSIVKPSYISFFSAIFLHGGTTQIPIEMQMACLKNRRAVEYQDEKITFHRMKPQAFVGFEIANGANGRRYSLATIEKAVADCIAYPQLCPIEEVRGAVERFGNEFDRVKCMKYVQLFENKNAEKRMEGV